LTTVDGVSASATREAAAVEIDLGDGAAAAANQQGTRAPIPSETCLGPSDGDALVYVGRVGTGRDRKTAGVPCLHDQSKLQPNARQKSEFLEGAAISGLTTEQLSNVWALFASTILNQPDFIALLDGRVPSVQTLFDVWETTPLSHLHLNAIGIAIAHANAVQVVGFDADLKFWIK
jgi:hypothetical protein